MRSGAVCVDIELICAVFRKFQCVLYGFCGICRLSIGRRDMVRVAGCALACHFTVDMRSSGDSVFVFLKNKHSCALSEHKSA